MMGIVPGVLLTGAVAQLRRRGRVARAAVLMVVAITAVSAAGALAQLILQPASPWLPLATALVSMAIGYGYLTRQLVRHREALRPGPRRSQ
ncbi:hypothetical protein JNW90_01215 [Micromonospora sp. STR1s_5]|nr:hypothetical protein [Micromonospora sp. STR1s_5]